MANLTLKIDDHLLDKARRLASRGKTLRNADRPADVTARFARDAEGKRRGSWEARKVGGGEAAPYTRA